MYAAVPRIIPGVEAMVFSVGEFDNPTASDDSIPPAFANPKSRTFTAPSWVILILPGFRSR
jgi:hypothetical protein